MWLSPIKLLLFAYKSYHFPLCILKVVIFCRNKSCFISCCYRNLLLNTFNLEKGILFYSYNFYFLVAKYLEEESHFPEISCSYFLSILLPFANRVDLFLVAFTLLFTPLLVIYVYVYGRGKWLILLCVFIHTHVIYIYVHYLKYF